MDWNLQVVVSKDPVCWMAVDTASALNAEYNGERYYFCSRGCLLDFQDDPEKYLDAGYRPSAEMAGMADGGHDGNDGGTGHAGHGHDHDHGGHGSHQH
jgi:Cu+-exporting ATPase